jgi:hypothetical protein
VSLEKCSWWVNGSGKSVNWVSRKTVSQPHLVLIGFSDLNEMCIGQRVFTDLTVRSVFMANFSLAEVVSVKLATRPWVCAVLCETSKQMVNLSVH